MARTAAMPKADASDDATHERLQHAKRAGVQFPRQKMISDDGKTTNTKRRVIKHPLETALSHEWITVEMYAAGYKMRELMYGARAEDRTIPSYSASVDNAASGVSTGEYRDRCSKAYEKAKLAIRARERMHFITWLEECELMDMTVAMLGGWFTPRQDRHAVAEVGIYVMCSVLADLADHFGYEKKIPKKRLDTAAPAQI